MRASCHTREISFLQCMNENAAQLDSNFDLEQSMTCAEVKEPLDSEQRLHCRGS